MADNPEKPKSAMAAFMENKWFVSSLELITIVLSIVSITSSVSAYNKLKNAAVDLQSISDNWAAKPVYAVEVVSGSACPTGFNSMPTLTWPGAETGNCACPSSATYKGKSYTSSYTSCNTNQTSAGCLTDPAVSSVTLNTWKSRRLCYQQGGEPAVTFAPFYIRPRPTAGTCPTGYRKCNRGNYDVDKAFCFPSKLKCPVAGLSVGSSGVANFSTNTSSSVAFDDGTKLYVGRFIDSMLPLVDLAVAFTGTSGGSTAGPCYYKEQRQNRYTGLTSWDSSLGSTMNDYPGKCKLYDTRYNVIDTVSEYKLLLDNFQNSTTCAGYNIKTTTVDYRAGGTACSGTNCALPAASTLSCSSTDYICLNVKYQTKCGKLQHFATQAKDSNRVVGVFGRPEIFWKSSCIKTQDNVKSANRPVNTALKGQYALMVINILVNVIVGLIFPILMIINALWGDIPCCPGSGKAEKILVGGIKNKWSHLFRLIKLIPLISAILATDKVVHFFILLAKGSCSDSVTNFTISYLSTTLPSVRQSNFTTLVMDVLQMLMAVALTCYATCKKKDSKTEPFQELPSVRTPGPSPGGPPGFDPNLAPQGPTAYYPQVPMAPQQYPPPGYVPAPYPQTYPQQPGQVPYYPPPQQQPAGAATATTSKTMLCVIPKGAKPGDVIELVSLEGVPVKYIVPPNGQPGQHMNITYEAPL